MDTPPYRRSFPRHTSLPPDQYGLQLLGAGAAGARELVDLSEHGVTFVAASEDEAREGQRLLARVTMNGEPSELSLIVTQQAQDSEGRLLVSARFAYEEGYEDFLDANTEQLAVVRDVLESALQAITRKP